jgi:hypothetical protein
MSEPTPASSPRSSKEGNTSPHTGRGWHTAMGVGSEREGSDLTTMGRPIRTPEQLRAASEHLYYEVNMFDAVARALMSGLFGEGVVRNAFLESFTIHSRALVQFFFATAPKMDDVIAEDYFLNQETWRSLRAMLPAALNPVNGRVGKEIAPLIYARLDVSPEEKGWNIMEIWRSLNGLVAMFVKNSDPGSLGPSWPVPTPQPKD